MLRKTITLLILASFSKWRDKVSVGENKENTARLFFLFLLFMFDRHRSKFVAYQPRKSD